MLLGRRIVTGIISSSSLDGTAHLGLCACAISRCRSVVAGPHAPRRTNASRAASNTSTTIPGFASTASSASLRDGSGAGPAAAAAAGRKSSPPPSTSTLHNPPRARHVASSKPPARDSVIAMSTADFYDLRKARETIQQSGLFTLESLHPDLDAHVLLVSYAAGNQKASDNKVAQEATPTSASITAVAADPSISNTNGSKSSSSSSTSGSNNKVTSSTAAATAAAAEMRQEAFVFHPGTFVAWHMPDAVLDTLRSALRAAEVRPYEESIVLKELEWMAVRSDRDTATTRLESGEIVVPPAKPGSSSDADVAARLQEATLERFSISDGMSLSVKLAIWEDKLNEQASRMEWLPESLSRGAPLNISQTEVHKQLGELLVLRHRINLMTNLSDFYWDRPALERLYERTCNFLDIPVRRKITNERLTFCSELAELLRTITSENHGRKLEWLIIFLIAIEVAFGCIDLSHMMLGVP